MGGYINTDRGEFLNYGVSPRQRRVHILRWNPTISGFTRAGFENYFSQYKGIIPRNNDDPLDWTVWDWQDVNHRDLFVMVQVEQEINGIVWGGFLGGFPYQYKRPDGKLTKNRFFETDVMYMHRIEKTNILTADRLCSAIPEVDWLHGHSGQLLSIESAEKLGLFLVDELRKVEESEDIYFDDYEQKLYVLSDILTYMCPELKKRLLAAGKNESPRITDINNLMVTIKDEDYSNWSDLESHLGLGELNGILM